MWTKQRIIGISVVATGCLFLLLPALLSPYVSGSASRKIAVDHPFILHAAADTGEVNLWFGPLFADNEEVKSDSLAEMTGQKITWTGIDVLTPQDVKLKGVTPAHDTLTIDIRLTVLDKETEIILTSKRSCSYFARLWKWILSWQDKRVLHKKLDRLESLMMERADRNLYYGFVVSETGLAQQHFTGYRANVGNSDLFRYFSYNIQSMYGLAQGEHIPVQGRACLLRYSSESATDSTDVFVGLPTPAYTQLEGTQTATLPPGTYAATIASGGEEQITLARRAIRTYLLDRNLTLKMPVVEEYIHETASLPDPSRWKTKVYAAYK
jgi:hypothetical protein